MFKETYNAMNEKLEPGNELTAVTVNRMAARRGVLQGRAKHGKAQTRRPVRAGRVFAAALAIVLALALSFTAVATTVPSFRELLFGGRESAPAGNNSSPARSALDGILTEVENVSAEYDGFRLEILGATHDQESMAIYYTLTDLSGQNRLNRNTEICPGTDIFDRLQQTNLDIDDDMVYSSYTTDLLDYNAETDTVLCRYVLDTQNAGEIDLSKVDFSISLVLLDSENIVMQPVSLNESDFTSETLEMDGQKILKPGETPLSMEGLGQNAVTAVGFVDGKLHIQTKTAQESMEYFQADIQPVDKAITPEEVARAGGYTLEFERRESEAYYARTGTMVEEDGGMKIHTVHGAQYFFDLENGMPVPASSEDFFDHQYAYQENTFDISPEEMQYYNFYYSQISYKKELRYDSWEFEDSTGRSSWEGLGEYHSDFQVSFEVADAAKSGAKTLTGLSVGGGTIDTLTVSALGITVEADRPLAEKAEITAQCGGETVRYTKTIVSGVPVSKSIVTVDSYTGPVTVKYLADRLVDPKTISSLTINGVEIPLE